MSAPLTRNLTILLTDIKGFTDKTSRKSRSDIQRMLERHKELVLPLLESKGGKLVKTIGDAFLMVYESPTDAVLAGVAVQDALREHNEDKPDADRLEVRIAINVGEVNIADNDIFGEPVNITARIESVAEAGEVFFTEAVYWAMNKTEVPSSEVGLLQLKGIREKIRVYKVRRERPLEDEGASAPSATFGRGLFERLRLPSSAGARELPPESAPKARVAAGPAPLPRRAAALLIDAALCWLLVGFLPIGAGKTDAPKPSDGFGTLALSIPARPYRGRRVRFEAYLKTRGGGEAATWARADKADGTVLVFNDMKDYTDWWPCQAPIQVPASADKLYFGIKLNGPGEVWADDIGLVQESGPGPSLSRQWSANEVAGWRMMGTRPRDYQAAVDPAVTRSGAPTLHLSYAAPVSGWEETRRLDRWKDGQKKAWFPLFWVIYSALFLGLYAATPGKMIMKLKVTTISGAALDWRHSVARSMSMLFSFYLLGLGFAWALFERDRRAWHDLICGTRVISD